MKKRLAISLLSSLLLAGALTGCTVVPKAPVDKVASFDGNTANSGFIGYNADGSGVITPHARDRYNALVATYGAKMAVPIQRDYGITARPDGNYTITAQALVYFVEMNVWRKAQGP
jgi:hypothetical protein